MLNPFIVKTPMVVNDNKDALVYIGHGEGNTKWKGWKLKLLLIKLNMLFFLRLILWNHKIYVVPKVNRTLIQILTKSCSTVEL